MTDPAPVEIPNLDDEPWEPEAEFAGGHWNVHPVKGLIAEENWAMNVRKPWRMLTPLMILRYLLGYTLRREYPSSERALRKARRDCATWCERMNAYEARQKELA